MVRLDIYTINFIVHRISVYPIHTPAHPHPHPHHQNYNQQHNKGVQSEIWADILALEGEEHLANNRLHDSFKNLRKLRSDSTKPSSIINDKNGLLLPNLKRRLERWIKHFQELLKRPSVLPAVSIDDHVSDSATTDSDASNIPEPTLAEISSAIKRLKNNKSPGVCGITSEMQHSFLYLGGCGI